MGEVTENIHTFALPNESQPYTFKMKYRYDSWKICASRMKRKLVFCSEAQPNLRVANRVQGEIKGNILVVLNQYAAGAQASPHSEDECYWYHPDHLGSASWVSDKAGKGIQHLYYLPWGEELANQRVATSGFESRYTFSGKERDMETGYGYFGARYYNSALSIWLSVDPLADKYPGMSPYTYCADNPVRLVDPDGREVVNPYTAKVAEIKNVISIIKQMMKEGNCDIGLAKAALRRQKEELSRFEWLEGKANIAIEALKEDEDFFNKLNNLQDEHTNTIDVYITYNFNMPSQREAQCNIQASVLYERDQNGNINVHFFGFKSNRVYIELSGKNDALNVCHEGGHLEYEIYECKYSKYLLWQIQNDCHYDGYNGHGEGDESGERAVQRENEYKARHQY